jgi:hypothetical protein
MRMTPRLLAAGLTAATLSIAPIGFSGFTSPLAITAAQAATVTVDINIFFDQLAPHGVWVKHAKYHYIFCPKVDADWRPYTHGHWIYLKDWGWYFASSEPFAWAVYHYGRWFEDQRLGWCWVPGNAWASAWVAWRRSNDYIGWAPLEPDQDGFQVNVSISKSEPPQHDWVFVPPKRFLEPQLNVAIVVGDRQPDAFQKTQFVGPVVVQNNKVINNVIEVNFIQQVTNTTVVVVNPTIVDQPQSADVSGNTVAVFAPPIAPPKQDEAPKQAADPDQAAQQLGKPAAGASSAPASAEVSASASVEASAPASASASAPSASAPSSAAPSSAPASVSSAAPSSSLPPSSASAPSSAAPSSAPSSMVSSSSVAPSSAAASAPSSAAASAPPSSSVLPSSEEPAASAAPSTESSKKPPVCPDGYILVKGKCVPAPSSAAQ